MGKGKDLFDIGRELYDSKQHLDTLDKFLDAAQRASEGKNPAAKSGSIEQALSKLDLLAQKLTDLADNGMPAPALHPVSPDEIIDPTSNYQAVSAHWENLIVMRQSLAEGKAQAVRISEIQRESSLKAELASQLSGKLLNLADKTEVIAPLGGPLSAPSITSFETHLKLIEAKIKLGDVADAAEQALKRYEGDISDLEHDTSIYAVTLDTFTNPDYYPAEAPSNEERVGPDEGCGVEPGVDADRLSGDVAQKSYLDDGQFHWDAADHTPALDGGSQTQVVQLQSAEAQVCTVEFTETMEQNACVDKSIEYTDVHLNENHAPEPHPQDQNTDQSVIHDAQDQPDDWGFSQGDIGQHDVCAGDYSGGDHGTVGGGSK